MTVRYFDKYSKVLDMNEAYKYTEYVETLRFCDKSVTDILLETLNAKLH